MKKEIVGVYGGTFSPPHVGHVHAARAFLQAVKPDKLLIVPNRIPPHKQRDEATSDDDRMEMCRLAFDFSPVLSVSDIEFLREGKSYTADTLAALERPWRELYFICGTDMFLTLSRWRSPEVIFRAARIAYIVRKSADVSRALTEAEAYYRKQYGARILRIDCECLELSSGDIRAWRREGNEAWRGGLPAAVADYIEKQGLYL